MNLANDEHLPLRRSAYGLLICLGLGVMLGRVLCVDAVDRTALEKDQIRRIADEVRQKRQQLQRQDISQQNLNQKLKAYEHKLYRKAQLRRPFLSANDRSRWCTARALVEPRMRVEGAPYAIDKVIQQPNWDTIDMVNHNGHLYSSKPPLLSTLMAGIYWMIFHATGMSLETHPFVVARIMLLLINIIPLTIAFMLLARLIDRFGATDWGRLFVMGSAVFGTFLTTFAVTINNHLVAAVCATVMAYAIVPIFFDQKLSAGNFILAAFFGALMAACELPALSLFAIITFALLWKAPRLTLLAYLPPAAIVVFGFFLTTWISYHSLLIPYLHRGETDNWYDYAYRIGDKEIESYWRHPVGIDQGEPSRAIYALNVLVGHHGIFSLTPIWLLSAAGIILVIFRSRDRRWRYCAAVIGLVSLICIAFYLFCPLQLRNYGGMNSGFRWMFWLAP
ncbi:MAG: hypothetical protein ACWGMZ_08355, partial [Thermoguttaceae bacterium]